MPVFIFYIYYPLNNPDINITHTRFIFQSRVYLTITIVLATPKKLYRVVSEIAGVFFGRAISESIAREGHITYNVALCFQPIKTLDFL